MRPGFELTKVLITVMTYPYPSKKYQETVCTAGVTQSGEWIRLYPVDYRYRPKHQRFRKWQWIAVALGPRGHGSDQRAESREPDLSTVRLLGEPLSTKDQWRARRAIIDAMPTVGRNPPCTAGEQLFRAAGPDGSLTYSAA